MAQTVYNRSLSGASPGTPGDSNHGQRASYLNDEGAAIPVGIAVQLKSEGKAELFDTATAELAGIVMNDFARSPDGLTGLNGIQIKGEMSVLEEGAAYVHCEQTVAVTDPVYCRHTSDGAGNTILGKFRKDSDAGKARLVKGARFVKAGSTTEAPIVYFSRSVDKAAQKIDSEQLQVVLSAAGEAANAIVVSGVVKDMNGNAVTSAKQVLVQTLAQTADKGDITVTVGTSKEEVEEGTRANVAWIETTAAGAFAFSVANDAAEDTLVHVTTEGGVSALLKLTFA